jgi:hypothetical protein
MMTDGEMVSQPVLVRLFLVRVQVRQPLRGIGEAGSRIHGMDESRVRLPYPPPGPIVYRLGHMVFIHESGVRFPVGPPGNGGVAQLVRASACHAEGRGFESLHSRQSPHS